MRSAISISNSTRYVVLGNADGLGLVYHLEEELWFELVLEMGLVKAEDYSIGTHASGC